MATFLDLKTVVSTLGGEGIVSDNTISAGNVCVAEKPLFFLQTISNKQNALVCGCCCRFVGSLDLQLKLLSRKISRVNINPSSDECTNPTKLLSSIVPCSHNCGEIYCSDICRATHWSRMHNITCTGRITEEEAATHPLIEFKTHALMTNEIFLLVADVFAVITNELIANGANGAQSGVNSATYELLQTYVREQWWDAAVAPPGTNPRELKMTLKRLVLESWRMLVKAYASAIMSVAAHSSSSASTDTSSFLPPLDTILNSEYMSRTIGMFEQNNVGVRLQNPVISYIKTLVSHVRAGGVDREQELLATVETVREIVANIEKEAEIEDGKCA
jgi:hypothetical protein